MVPSPPLRQLTVTEFLCSRLTECRQWQSTEMYFIGQDGQFFKAEQLLFANDSAATKAAERFVDGLDVELWQANRKIAKFDASQKGRSQLGNR